MGYGDSYIQNVTNTLQRQGDNAANAQLRQGDISAQTLGQLGQIASALPANIQQAQHAAQVKQELAFATQLAHTFKAPDGQPDWNIVAGKLLERNPMSQVASEIQTRAQAQQKASLDAKNINSEITTREGELGVKKTTLSDAEKATADAKAKAAQVTGILQKHAGADGLIKGDEWGPAIAEVRLVDPAQADKLHADWLADQANTRATTDATQKSLEQQKKDAATLLMRYTTPQDYAQKLAGLSPDVQKLFPTAPPKNRGYLLKVGMSPSEIATQTNEESRIGLERDRLAMQQRALDIKNGASVTPEDVAYYAREYQKDPALTEIRMKGLPGVKAAVEHALASNGVNVTKLSAQGKMMQETAVSILPMINKVSSLAKQIQDLGLMGSLGGRERQLIAGESAAADIKGLTPEQRKLVGQFATESGLLISGVARAHGGAPTMILQLEKILGSKDQDINTYLGNLTGAKEWMQNYADMGGGGGDTKKLTAEELIKKYGGG